MNQKLAEILKNLNGVKSGSSIMIDDSKTDYIFNYYKIDEEKMDKFFLDNIITDETINNLINTTTISNSKFKSILLLNIKKIIHELD